MKEDNFKLLVGIYNPTKKDYELKYLNFSPSESGMDTRTFQNNLTEPTNQVKAVLEVNSESYTIKFSEYESKNGNRVFKGKLEAGKPSELGISLTVKITEIPQSETETISYGITGFISEYKKTQIPEKIKKFFLKLGFLE